MFIKSLGGKSVSVICHLCIFKLLLSVIVTSLFLSPSHLDDTFISFITKPVSISAFPSLGKLFIVIFFSEIFSKASLTYTVYVPFFVFFRLLLSFAQFCLSQLYAFSCSPDSSSVAVTFIVTNFSVSILLSSTLEVILGPELSIFVISLSK